MGISSIGNYNYTQQYQTNIRNNRNVSSSNTVPAGSANNFTLRLHDDDGNKAITCVALPNGVSASVFKSDTYTEENPVYTVKYWDSENRERQITVDLKNVNPENASYLEMAAYTTYLDEEDYTKDAFGHFIMAAKGTDTSMEYSTGNINTKMNFKEIIKSFMDMQYSAGNLEGYLSYKKLYEFMNGLRKQEN